MKNKVLQLVVLLVLVFSTQRCREPFEPVIPANQNELLVVEGYINTGGGVTTIKLSRSTPINVVQREAFVTKAQVSIEAESGEKYVLHETAEGQYASDFLDLDAAGKYRLNIKTADDKEYASAFVQSQVTPAIDDVHWNIDNGINIYVDTHDEANKTWYYQWEFEEIWEIRSPYPSYIKYENGTFSDRDEEEMNKMMYCWRFEKTPDLIFGSSVKLQSDDINNFFLKSIPMHSEVLGFKYSMLVKQHALSKAQYQYLQMMRKNTDAVGSLFDPQPSELRGNIFCISDPEEMVIGFMGAYTTEEKRVIINNSDLAQWSFDPEMACWKKLEIIPYDPFAIAQGMRTKVPMELVYDTEDPKKIVGVRTYAPICIDCRTRGGNQVPKPNFW